MSSNLIKRLRYNTAFRLSFMIAITLMISLLFFSFLIRPLVEKEILKINMDLIQYKINQFRAHYNNTGYEGLKQILHDYEKEAKILGVMVRVVDKNSKVLWVTYPNEEIAGILLENIQAYTSVKEDWIQLNIPVPLTERIERIFFGPRNTEHFVMFKTARLSDSLTIQVGSTLEKRNQMEGYIKVLFKFMNIFFTSVIFICSVVLIQIALKPLKDLLNTINEIANGDMTARVHVRNPHTDIGKTATMFNFMLDKMESFIVNMKESLDNVAHDLRTPLSRMRLGIEEAVQRDDKEFFKEALFDCAEETEKLDRQLKTMMDITEAEAETMNLFVEDINLKDAIYESVNQYDYLIEDKILQFKFQLAKDLTIMADPSRIRQILINLIDNAIKYTPEGGIIEIITKDNQKSVLLTVKDNGIGISKDDMKHIFERLYRADKSRSTKGLGLGLSLVKAVLKAHRGEIKVQSEPGKGSEFHLLIPKNFRKDSTLDWKTLQN